MPTTKAVEPRDRPRVLLIEDNLTQLDLYAMVVEDSFDVLTATRGETGYAIACVERPDAIIIDVLLPDIDGLAICERLVAEPLTASTPLIVLTGDDGAYDRAKALPGIDAVLKKPCPADVLVSALRNVLSLRTIH